MKDAKGHGSDTGTKGMRLIKTHTLGPHSAKVYNNPEWGEKVVKFFHNGQYQSKADSHTDDLADAHATAQFQLKRYAEQDAKASLASGPKSAPVPTHDAMSADAGSRNTDAFGRPRSEDSKREYDDYNRDLAYRGRQGNGGIGSGGRR